MATNYTTNYGLCQWEPEDDFIRAEFNQDNAKIDAALAAKADASSVNSRFSSVSGSISSLTSRVEVRVGTYTGDGEAVMFVNLGFTPKAVLVEGSTGQRSATTSGCYGGLALPGQPVNYSGVVALEIVTNGFNVAYDSGKSSLNTKQVHRYIAFK